MKDILGFEGQYAVTKCGKIWSYKRKEYLTPWFLKTGYARVGLRDTKNKQKRSVYLVHRLVALAYIENKENKLEVNHKNGIRDDNRVENLEWVTRSENNQHAWDYGKKVYVRTEKNIEAVKKNIVIARAIRMAKLKEREANYAA